MIIWLLERSNKAAQAQCLELLSKRAAAVAGGRVNIQWRVLPPSRLWAECVELVKKEKYPSHQYPSLIEYPLAWQESFEYLNFYRFYRRR